MKAVKTNWSFIRALILASLVIVGWSMSVKTVRADEGMGNGMPHTGETMRVRLFVCDTPDQINQILEAQQLSWGAAMAVSRNINTGEKNEYGEPPCGTVSGIFTFVGPLDTVENVFQPDGTTAMAYPVVVELAMSDGDDRLFVAVFNKPLTENPKPEGDPT